MLLLQEQPYVMLKSRNNTTFALEGFCIDLLDAIASLVGFKYNISLVPDGKYGVYDYKTGEWNGMVRQLIDKVRECNGKMKGNWKMGFRGMGWFQKADLAVGSMTINYARESVIDFTKPFMNLGISILFKVRFSGTRPRSRSPHTSYMFASVFSRFFRLPVFFWF